MRTNTIQNFAMRFATIAIVLLTVGVGSAWSATETYSYSDYKGQGTVTYGSSYTMTKTSSSIGDSKFYVGSSASYGQLYAGGKTTITPINGGTIKQVVLTASSISYNGYQSSGTFSASIGSVTGSTSSATVTWTGTATSAFTITHSKQIRWTSIVVTFLAKVTFNANGGSCATSSLTQSTPTSTITLPTPNTRAGYTFNGWYTAPTGGTKRGNAGDSYKPSASETLYAQWEASCTSQEVIVEDEDKSDEGTYNYGISPIGLEVLSNGTGAVTWSSSNTSVATVTGDRDGATVTIAGAGSATITANVAADATYCAGSGEYALTVNSVAPTLSHNTSGKELTISSITSTGATFYGGVVTSKGGDASLSSYGFIVGTSADVKYKDRVTQAGTNEDYPINTAFGSQSVTGLTPNTTYYVRAIANNSGGHIGYDVTPKSWTDY